MATPDDPTRQPKPLAASLEPERQRTIERLQEAFASDLMTLEELDERLELAEAARTAGDLAVLTRDLPAEAAPAARPTGTALAPLGRRQSLLALFGGVERRGTWTVPAELKVRAVFGGAVLDFRDAQFEAGVTDLKVTAVFGGVEIRVPPWLRVESAGSGIFGGFSDCNQAPADPSAPVLRVHGIAVFGGVDVHARKSKA